MEQTEQEVFQDDIGAILRALGLGDHARPASPHMVVQEEILPHIRAVMGQDKANPSELPYHLNPQPSMAVLLKQKLELLERLQFIQAKDEYGLLHELRALEIEITKNQIAECEGSDRSLRSINTLMSRKP